MDHTDPPQVASQANPTWGSRRIQAELAKLGIQVSDSTVRRYRPKLRHSSQTWQAILRNHVQALVATDFLTVPTGTGRVLFVFLLRANHRRKVFHFSITDAPSSSGTAQELTEATA